MKYSQWNIAKYEGGSVLEIQKRGAPLLVAHVLASRGYHDDPDGAIKFLSEDRSSCRDPLELPDMEKAVERIRKAARDGELVAVYGDYDVDGITSLSLMLRCFREDGIRCIGYIPDRVDEGYGLNCEAIDYLASQGASLIVTVDCGITAVNEVAYARSLGLDVVITDHHECKEQMPDAVAVVNPRRPDCIYEFTQFSGVGVAHKLLCAIYEEYGAAGMMEVYSPLVAIGTVADVMPLVDENRAIVRAGLSAIRDCRILGLKKLLEASGLAESNVTSSGIGYTLAPRINAAGRMGKADIAVDLLLTNDEAEAERLAQELCSLNRERQQVENEIFKEATLLLRGAVPTGAVVLSGEGWHQGVIGIVASRLVEICTVPAFLISLDGEYGKASCRSYGGFNLFQALEQAGDLLESYGGHALAAGFVIRRENIPAFKKLMDRLWNEYAAGAELEPVLNIDCELNDPSLLTLDNVYGLQEMEPFGAGNPSPVFCISDVEVLSAFDVGGGKHLKLTLNKGGMKLDAIFFSHTANSEGIEAGDMVDVAFCPNINDFMGRQSVQLLVNAIRQNQKTRRQDEEQLVLFERFRSGAALTAYEAAKLLPPRESFVAIWRFLKSHAENGEIRGERTYLARMISRIAGMPPCVLRFLVSLDVLEEMGLIELYERGAGMHIKMLEIDGKVDLNKSRIIQGLRSVAGRNVI